MRVAPDFLRENQSWAAVTACSASGWNRTAVTMTGPRGEPEGACGDISNRPEGESSAHGLDAGVLISAWFRASLGCMTVTVLVTTPLRVRILTRKDASGVFFGQVKEYPGLITQGKTRASVGRKLIRLLREISREHPEELSLFR